MKCTVSRLKECDKCKNHSKREALPNSRSHDKLDLTLKLNTNNDPKIKNLLTSLSAWSQIKCADQGSEGKAHTCDPFPLIQQSPNLTLTQAKQLKVTEGPEKTCKAIFVIGYVSKTGKKSPVSSIQCTIQYEHGKASCQAIEGAHVVFYGSNSNSKIPGFDNEVPAKTHRANDTLQELTREHLSKALRRKIDLKKEEIFEKGVKHTLMCWYFAPQNKINSLSKSERSLANLAKQIPQGPNLVGELLKNHDSIDLGKKKDSPEILSQRRLCHADTSFPLDYHQSKAAFAISKLNPVSDDIWMQTVTGPPGTGKTSMMRSVIMDTICGALLKGRPARILAAGPTHQSINNLLDAITFDWSGNHPLSARWIDIESDSIGAKIPNGRRNEETKSPILSLVEKGKSYPIEGLSSSQFKAHNRHPLTVNHSKHIEPILQAFNSPEGFREIAQRLINSVKQTGIFQLEDAAGSTEDQRLLSLLNQIDEAIRNKIRDIGGSIEFAISKARSFDERAVKIPRCTKNGKYSKAKTDWKHLLFTLGLYNKSSRRKYPFYLWIKLYFFGFRRPTGEKIPYTISKSLIQVAQGIQEISDNICSTVHGAVPLNDQDVENLITKIFNGKGNAVELVDQMLDIRQRHQGFLLTARLGEVRTLATIAAYHVNSNSNINDHVYEALAYLLPVRATTAASIGYQNTDQFKLPIKSNTVENQGWLTDLTLIDEAGQMSPELIPPAAATTKHLLAVGDPYQIPPVIPDPMGDLLSNLMEDAGIKSNQDGPSYVWNNPDIEDPKKRAPPNKGRNGLSIIERHSRYQNNQIVLQGHYRCPESIINISNLLSYEPRGIPLEPNKPDPIVKEGQLPVIGSLLHDFDPSGPGEKSQNAKEAELIAQWTSKNLHSILSLSYEESDNLAGHIHKFPDEIAFISPFRAQSKSDPANPSRIKELKELGFCPGDGKLFEGLIPNYLRRQIRKDHPQIADMFEKDIINEITFGTVHALQGAERPIVVFSCVSAQNSRFLDRDPALVNVGVSRAKRSLIFARHRKFGTEKSSDGFLNPSAAIKQEADKFEIFNPEN